MVALVGRKNSGKTTLLVALATELGRRGLRVASLKHGHHAFEMDTPGRDSWRHFHEGGVGAVVVASSGKVALIERFRGEPDPRELVTRLLGGRGYDLVLVEGYKSGPFPRIEVHRAADHPRPLLADGPLPPPGHLALVTDRPGVLEPGIPVLAWGRPEEVAAALADLLLRSPSDGGG